MGTLKDEMRGVSEDRLLREKAEDGEDPESSDGSSVTETSQKNTDEESTTREDKPKMDCNKDSKDNDICIKADATNSVERQSISVAVPSTPDPTDPRSPAPFGQHHMRTQVSLEVVQCCSAATSPMTPPEGGQNSFFFPSSFGKVEAVGTDTKDAELQVGQQVEYSSVATSPMTPKTPFFSSFPPLPSRETVQRKTEEGQGCQVGTKNPAESEISGALKLSSSKGLESEDLSSSGTPVSSANCPAGSVMNLECKQQRMGSMDQDITILVTQHGNNDEEEDKDKTLPTACPVEPEMVKLEEEEEEEDRCQDKNDTADECDQENSKSTIKTQEASAKSGLKSANSLEAQDNKDVVPESPAPFGCHNMRTQVSLEVVQCHSAATSPMTPPEGDQAFCFPSTLTECGAVGTETKDAELQVGQQVEYRSVATAPMTPRTPIATTFPEIQKGASIEEKIVEEEEEKESTAEKDAEEKEEEGCDEGKQTEEQKNEEMNCKEDKCEEPVQEVSWDDKGMTWEVYGAVVEVSVLGSAIQKHLEKQVKKQKKQTSMPPPPPLNPSATPLSTSEASPRGSGSGKGRGSKRGEGKPSRRRRNPFRLMMENMQQPHCCSRAHTTE